MKAGQQLHDATAGGGGLRLWPDVANDQQTGHRQTAALEAPGENDRAETLPCAKVFIQTATGGEPDGSAEVFPSVGAAGKEPEIGRASCRESAEIASVEWSL